MTFLVIGEYYSDNLGDPLLCQVVTKILQKEYPESKIIPFDISGKVSMIEYYSATDINYNKFLSKVKRKFRRMFKLKRKPNKYDSNARMLRHLEDILKQYDIDLAIFAGGEMFMDFFVERIGRIIKRLKNINVIFHACGVHDLSAESIQMLGSIVKKKNVHSISLRDSYERFTELFGNDKICETYDTALLCSEFYESSKAKQHEYGIGIIANESIFEFELELIKHIIKCDLDWQLFTNGASYDYDFAIKLLSEAGLTDNEINIKLHDRPTNVQELIDEVTGYEKIISFRMHSQIVAASFGIPCFGFVWDNKVKEFYDKLGYSQNYSAPQGSPKDKLNINALNIPSNVLSEKARLLGSYSKECLLEKVNSIVEDK